MQDLNYELKQLCKHNRDGSVQRQLEMPVATIRFAG